MSWPIGKSSFSTRMNASAEKNGVDKGDDVGENYEVKDEDGMVVVSIRPARNGSA